jgi:hypothetical protein
VPRARRLPMMLIFDRCVVCGEQQGCEGEWELKCTVHSLAAVCVAAD